MDQAKTGFRDMGFDDSKVEAISAQLGVQDSFRLVHLLLVPISPFCFQVGKSLIVSFFNLFSFGFTKCRHAFVKLID
jgi:hypothetical protein